MTTPVSDRSCTTCKKSYSSFQDGHHHRLTKHKGEESHDTMSTAHRARDQFGTSTVRAHTGEDYRYITGFLTLSDSVLYRTCTCMASTFNCRFTRYNCNRSEGTLRFRYTAVPGYAFAKAKSSLGCTRGLHTCTSPISSSGVMACVPIYCKWCTPLLGLNSGIDLGLNWPEKHSRSHSGGTRFKLSSRSKLPSMASFLLMHSACCESIL